MSTTSRSRDPLLGTRAAVILTLSLLLGLITGTLAFFSPMSAAASVLSGLATAGASVVGLHSLLDDK